MHEHRLVRRRRLRAPQWPIFDSYRRVFFNIPFGRFFLNSLVIAGFNTDVGPLYNDMSAAAVLVMIPTVILTLILQRYVVRGLTLGAVKG